MNQKYIQEYNDVPIYKSSSTVIPEKYAPIGEKVTMKHPPKITPWEEVHQMWYENQVNDILGTR